MRAFTEKRTTICSSIYKKVAIYSKFGCPLCPPNKGCNTRSNGESNSWKDQSKKCKQWKS